MNAALQADARAIWQAGVDAVRAERLVAGNLRVDAETLTVCGEVFSLSELGRILVVGAGKAGAGMAAAVEQALGPQLATQRVTGWVNVPADCVRPLSCVVLHPARPAGVNEPTEEGVAGAERILAEVAALASDDLCLVLLSGGGSALLPAPKPPITLADKQAVTRFLMHRGATINELNAVRKRLSRIKGGRLGRASRAGRTMALVISDIVGNPLDMIASGPTYPDPTTDRDALAVLEKFSAAPPEVPSRVLDALRAAAAAAPREEEFPSNVTNHIVGDNRVALAAAASRAEQLGYEVESWGSENTGEANEEGRKLARRGAELRRTRPTRPRCLLSGGEPIVQLARTDLPQKGGRNQQLVLAGLVELWSEGWEQMVLLSGGTDGEDGPTDAAGAIADADLWLRVKENKLDPLPYLHRNDAYHFFQLVEGLLLTGPTHTNVMDLRVVLVATESAA